ncbi:hypothetical protein ACFLWM_02595, partial [Chloroflexota bacterium]
KIIEDYLLQIENLSLLLIGGSIEAGTEFVVSADKPIPLTNILKEMPYVKHITKEGQIIHLIMKVE